MHIIIGLITAVAGLAWALNSLQNSGVDLNAFNPFTWARRKRWQKLYGVKPHHNLETPLEAATVVIAGVVKEIGEITSDQKEKIIDIFVKELRLSESAAKEAFSAAMFMIRDQLSFHQEVRHVFLPSIGEFTQEQAESLLDILRRVALIDGKINDNQKLIIQAAEHELEPKLNGRGKW